MIIAGVSRLMGAQQNVQMMDQQIMQQQMVCSTVNPYKANATNPSAHKMYKSSGALVPFGITWYHIGSIWYHLVPQW